MSNEYNFTIVPMGKGKAHAIKKAEIKKLADAKIAADAKVKAEVIALAAEYNKCYPPLGNINNISNNNAANKMRAIKKMESNNLKKIQAREKKQDEILNARKITRMKQIMGDDWYNIIEDTEFDCMEALYQRIDDDTITIENQLRGVQINELVDDFDLGYYNFDVYPKHQKYIASQKVALEKYRLFDYKQECKKVNTNTNLTSYIPECYI